MSFIQAKPAATHDLYGLVHKGLRLSLSDLLVRLGRADPADAQTCARLLADLRSQLRLQARHLAHEDQEVHAALDARCPGAARRLGRAHEDHRAAFAELEAQIVRVETVQRASTEAMAQAILGSSGQAAAQQEWRRLYLRFSEFVAEDLAHMAEEELVVLPVLQSLFTDEELAGVEHRIMASAAPEDIMGFARIMIAAGSHQERVRLLRAFRQAAPPQVYDTVIDTVVRPQMSAEDWQVLDWAIDHA
jgi:hemerythrin-like domain-containing protein